VPEPMKVSSTMSPQDDVGYGRPPRRTRYKPGQSGNPRGRPKGRRSIGTIVTSVLNRKVPLSAGGRQQEVPLKDAMILRIAESALKADLRAVSVLLQLAERTAQATDAASSPHQEQDDEAIIASFLERPTLHRRSE
jgi:hypothetical protein